MNALRQRLQKIFTADRLRKSNPTMFFDPETGGTWFPTDKQIWNLFTTTVTETGKEWGGVKVVPPGLHAIPKRFADDVEGFKTWLKGEPKPAAKVTRAIEIGKEIPIIHLDYARSFRYYYGIPYVLTFKGVADGKDVEYSIETGVVIMSHIGLNITEIDECTPVSYDQFWAAQFTLPIEKEDVIPHGTMGLTVDKDKQMVEAIEADALDAIKRYHHYGEIEEGANFTIDSVSVHFAPRTQQSSFETAVYDIWEAFDQEPGGDKAAWSGDGLFIYAYDCAKDRLYRAPWPISTSTYWAVPYKIQHIKNDNVIKEIDAAVVIESIEKPIFTTKYGRKELDGKWIRKCIFEASKEPDFWHETLLWDEVPKISGVDGIHLNWGTAQLDAMFVWWPSLDDIFFYDREGEAWEEAWRHWDESAPWKVYKFDCRSEEAPP